VHVYSKRVTSETCENSCVLHHTRVWYQYLVSSSASTWPGRATLIDHVATILIKLHFDGRDDHASSQSIIRTCIILIVYIPLWRWCKSHNKALFRHILSLVQFLR